MIAPTLSPHSSSNVSKESLKMSDNASGEDEQTMPNKTAEDLLRGVRDAGALDDNHGAEDWSDSDNRIAEAARQLFEMMMECVGEDEIPDPGTTWGGRHTRNGLRAEIRTKLIEVFKQEEE